MPHPAAPAAPGGLQHPHPGAPMAHGQATPVAHTAPSATAVKAGE